MALGRVIGKLKVVIGADTDDFDRGMANVKRDMSGFGRAAASMAKSGAAVGAAAVAAGAAIAAGLVINSVNAARELRTLSQVAGTTTSEFQALAYGARSVGIEADNLADIFKDARDRVGDFMTTGAGPMADFFEQIAPKIGVTADEFARLSGPEILQKYVASLEAANVSASQQVFFMEAMASDSSKLLPLLRDNALGFEQMANEAERLGLILSDVEVEQLSQAGSAMRRIQQVAGDVGNRIAVELAPYVEGIATSLQEAALEGDAFGGTVTAAINGVVWTIGVLADGVFRVQQGFKLMQAVGVSVANAIASSWANLAEGVSTVVTNMQRGYNSIARVLSMPLVDETGMGDWVARTRADAESTAASVEALWGEVEAMASQPLPSEQLNAWVEDVKAKSLEAAEAAAAAREGILAGDGTGDGDGGVTPPGGGGGGGADSAEAMQEKLDQQLEQLRNSLISEEQLEIESHERRLAELAMFRERQMLTEDEYRALREAAEAQHQERLTDIERRAAEMRGRLQRETLSRLTSTLDAIGSAMEASGEEQFGIAKAISIATALLKGYEAVTSSYAAGAAIGGPPVGIAFAALAAAQTAAQISQLMSVSSRSTGTPTAGGGGSVSQTPQIEQATQAITIGGGVSRDSMYSGDAIYELIDRINEAQADGKRVHVF